MMAKNGFTLAELLIALAILGVIATFTIPKVLQSQQDGKNNAIAKEAVSMISGAYSAYQMNTAVPATLTSADLTPYLNYVKYDTSSSMDWHQGLTGNNTCNSAEPCLRLHNGALLMLKTNVDFSGTSPTHAIYFDLDADGVFDNDVAGGKGKSIRFFLYYNGRVSTWGKIASNTQSSDGPWNPAPGRDPPWFSWN